jgi:anthranilate synthase component 2
MNENNKQRILILDNYDSFTYNLLHLVRELGYDNVEVHRNNKISIEEAERFDRIILSPGPGIPSEAGLLLPLISRLAPTKSMFGVCLGHQAIAESFGARLVNLTDVYHGVSTQIEITAPHSIFAGLPRVIEAGRYHSWAVSRDGFPEQLEITAISGDGSIMALRHRTLDVNGVQFHPESVLTPNGKQIMQNFLAS